MQVQDALITGFSHWLDEKFSRNRVPQSAPLDSFATSARNCGRTAPWMNQIKLGVPVEASRVQQALTDMASMGFVGRHDGEYELTALGSELLNSWSDLGVDQDDAETNRTNELIRCCVLIRTALLLGVERYIQHYRFWLDLIEIRPSDYWLKGGVWEIYLPSYLNGADSAGYNPFAVLRSLGGELGTYSEWSEWASDPEAPAGVGLLISKVNGNRPGGRLALMRAMELHRVATQEKNRFPDVLADWQI